jgi:phospholipid-binding lipoprotein MlaA
MSLALVVPAMGRAQQPPAADGPPAPVDDPFEPVNRVMFKIDRGINHLIGKRGVVGGAGFLPESVRTPLYNFFNNLDEPANVANDLLQQKWRRGAIATGRFATNSTVGLLGTVDVASRVGLPRHHEDFGQTLGKYGVKSGPYIFLPLAGPTALRDAAGDRVDGFANPLHYVDMDTPSRRAVSITDHIVQPHVIGIREQARALADTGQTTDEYAALRQMYFDQRRAEIEDRRGSGDYTLPVPPRPVRGVRPVDDYAQRTRYYARQRQAYAQPVRRPAPQADGYDQARARYLADRRQGYYGPPPPPPPMPPPPARRARPDDGYGQAQARDDARYLAWERARDQATYDAGREEGAR